jgi:hypothetical protein
MTPSVPWRYGISSTLKGVYVLRYLLFSGGAAIAGALLERATAPSHRPWVGFLVGFLTGLIIFRGQLRALRWPRLYLARDSLYLVQARRVVALPWKALHAVSPTSGRLTLSLKEPLLAPDGHPAEAIQLEASKLGVAAADLERALRGYVEDATARGRLPEDAQVLALLSPEPADGR